MKADAPEHNLLVAEVVIDVTEELERAVKRFGWQTHLSLGDYMNIIMEELGEVAREQNEVVLGHQRLDETLPDIRKELLQVAAMALKMIVVTKLQQKEREDES